MGQYLFSVPPSSSLKWLLSILELLLSYSLDRTFMENNVHRIKENQSSKLIVDPRDANELVCLQWAWRKASKKGNRLQIIRAAGYQRFKRQDKFLWFLLLHSYSKPSLWSQETQKIKWSTYCNPLKVWIGAMIFPFSWLMLCAFV